MPALKNTRDEKFARLIAIGRGNSAAWEEAGLPIKSNRGTIAKNAWQKTKTEKVSNRIAELRREEQERIKKEVGFERDELVHFLVSAIRTPIEDIQEGDKLCTGIDYKMSKDECRKILKTYGKEKAADQLIQILGWSNASEASESELIESVVRLISKVRGDES